MSPVVGVDLGGTKIAAALVDADGTCGAVTTVPTPAQGGPGALVEAVVGLVVQVAEASDPSAAQPLLAVGVGAAGAIDRRSGVVVSSTDTLAGWVGTPLADLVRTGLAQTGIRVPVAVLNDVDAHALGEARHGAAAGAASVLVVAAGTGIGGAVVLDGQLLRGAHHMAGEMGHVPVPGAEGLRCPCGRDGHLEAVAAGPALARLAQDARDGDGAGADHGAPPDAREVVALAAAGDATALAAVQRSATALGRALAGVVTVLDPEVVLLTGGLAGAGPTWWEAVDTGLRTELVDHLAAVPLRPGALGPAAAVVGAAEAARDLLRHHT